MGWWRSAACAQEDPELFFPVTSSGPGAAQESQAKAICESCPVIAECLEWAVSATPAPSGIWGGTSEEDRRAIQRRAARRR